MYYFRVHKKITVIKYIRSAALLIALTAGITSTTISCNKTDEQPAAKEQVYAAGYDWINNKQGAKLWSNTEGSALTDGTATSSSVSIAVSGNDVYVLGFETAAPYPRRNTKLWKNNVLQDFPNNNISMSPGGLLIDNNDVYISGFSTDSNMKNSGKIWKNGVPLTLTDEGRVNAIRMERGDIYATGFIYNSNGRYVATLWKNAVEEAPLENALDAIALSIFVYNNDVYITGRKSVNNTWVAMLWKNGAAQQLSDGTSYAEANKVFVYNNDVYVAGSQDESAVLWKNGQAQKLAGPRSRASSVYVTKNNVYVGGHVSNSNIDVEQAVIWKNGIAQLLEGPENTPSAVTDIYVKELK